MFRHFIQKAWQVITGGSHRLELTKQDDCIVIKSFKGKQQIPFSQLIKKHESLAPISPNLIPHEDEKWQSVPLGALAFVKQFLADFEDELLEIEIAPEVAALQWTSPPVDFEVRYVWSQINGRIEKQATQNAAYFGNGWFVGNQQYWRINGIATQDEPWLRQDTIAEQTILKFLSQITPTWQKHQLPFKTSLKYSADPVLSITIKEVDSNRLALNVNWKEQADNISITLANINHVIAANIVRPGIQPQQIVLDALKANGLVHLQGEEIALFQEEVWPLIKQWTDGNIAQYQAQHTIFQPKGELKLIVQHDNKQGIGMTIAVPTFVCRHFHIPAQEAAQLLATSTRYYRIKNGWVPVSIFEQAGITASHFSRDGQSLSPITLTPAEILHRGSERLQDVWKTVEFPPLTLPARESPVQTAILHLQFLKTWGISGGIIGSITHYPHLFETFFTSLTTENPSAKVLVVGTKKEIDFVAPLWENAATIRFNGNKSDPSFNPFQPGIVLATPNALGVHTEMIKTEWTVLCLLGADGLIKSNRSKLFQRLDTCYKMFTMGLFNSKAFLKQTQSREALSKLFGFPPYLGGTFVWGYALRNPTESALPLPKPYRMKSTTKLAHFRQEQTAVFNLGHASGTQAIPIPPRNREPKPAPDNSPFQIEINFTSHESTFVKQAKKLVKHKERKARFVPFQQYWPQYSSMTAQQQKWYFYWRNQVRKGNYPDTDLSYIFIHVYELINHVGVQNKMNGYDQLRQLWLNYRERYPKLDHYLLDWMADYVLVNGCPINPLALYADGAVEKNVSSRELDLVLANYTEQPFTEMPLSLIDKLTDHQILRSKFYLDGHQQLIQEYVPQTLEQVNLYLTQQGGSGIFERFKPHQPAVIRRRPFQGALYVCKANDITVATIFPYTNHPPLRHFLTGVAKHTENKLREMKGFNGRLRGYTLEPTIEAIIDQFIASKTRIIVPPPPKPKIEIDFAKVAQLTADQSEIFQMLQLPEEEEESHETMVTTPVIEPNDHASQEKPPATTVQNVPENVVTSAKPNGDLPPEWIEFADQLADYQFQTIKAIVTENDPSATISQIAEANITMPAPLLDEINEIAQDTMGDIIIDLDPTPHVSDEEYLEFLQILIETQT